MSSTQLKIRDDVVAKLEKREGNSFSGKIENLLKLSDSKEIDYDKIKSIFESSLTELKAGRL